ncbi:beta-N-acetylhexosaminidase [Radiobacillus kanasensis]|uniref:beta-N-acetylhexosaminidase n=1 Tax=Radiobacillus kanasensis TaxID=2844358 RepID=UPI002ED9BCD7
MKIKLEGEYSSLLPGIEALQENLDFALSEDGLSVKVEQQDGVGVQVSYENGRGQIAYEDRIHFFRGFGLFIEYFEKQEPFFIKEEPQFSTVGPMFDLSRNAVMKIDRFQEMIRTLALMGFNSAMLYMEDTYQIKDEPYFGYMRGRYTHDELKSLDDYADAFGIELIPCIQTLAHLEEFLKWSNASHLKDTRGALLLESEDTYDFIENMITSVTDPFRSKRIHIGMDEAEELGRGIYQNKFGYKSRLELMTTHLKRVLDIVKARGLEPMMWSDMFIKLASESGDDHYNMSTEIPEHIVENTPKDVQLMYWDYFHTDEEDYHKMIQKHKTFGKVPAFAGGIWVWNTFATNYGLSLRTSDAALNACKKEGIQDVFVTLWGDDGYENNFFTALLGLQMYAEHAYSKELDKEKLRERVKFCTGMAEETFLLLNELDETPGVEPGNMVQTNPSKFLLWQDVLIGLFDKHIEGLDLHGHYSERV